MNFFFKKIDINHSIKNTSSVGQKRVKKESSSYMKALSTSASALLVWVSEHKFASFYDMIQKYLFHFPHNPTQSL